MRGLAPTDRSGEPPRLAPAACALALGAAAGLTPAGPAVLAASAALLLGAAAWSPLRVLAPALLLGLLLGRLDDPRRAREALRALTELPAVLQVRGRVVSMDIPARHRLPFVLEVHALGEPPRALPAPLHLSAVLQLEGRARWRWTALAPGASVRVTARITERAGGLRAWIEDRRALEIETPARGLGAWIAHTRRRASWALTRRLAARDDGLARALLLGDRGRLARADRDLFRLTGQAHLLAVSGLHVGLLLSGLVLALRLLGTPPRLLWCLGLAATVAYVPFTGTQPSAVRAGLAACAWFLARLCGRHPRGAAVVALVAVLVLGTRPRALTEASFQLSFAAVLGILLLARRLRCLLVPERPVLPGLLPPRRAPARTALAISLAAWLGTAPLVAHHIGRLCPAGPLVAVVALPLTALLLAVGFLLLASTPLEPVADGLQALFGFAADALRFVLKGARRAHLDALHAARPSPLWHGLYAATLLLTARGAPSRRRYALGGLALLLGLLLLPTGVPGLAEVHGAWKRTAAEYDAARVSTPAYFAPPASPPVMEILAVAAGLLAFGVLSIRARWLGLRGAAAAWVLGVIAFLAFGPGGVAGLFAPFLAATLLGKLPGARRASARNLRQVLCNGVPAFLGCLLAISGRPDLGTPFFLGALACLGADTCATEAGVRWGGRPFRLAGRGPIRRGESGGVTLVGLLATLLAAGLAPAAFSCFAALPLLAFGVIVAGGVAGALLDSVLGGSLQFRGREAADGTTTERADADVARVSGWRWLDNDAVNLVAGLAGGFVALALAHLL